MSDPLPGSGLALSPRRQVWASLHGEFVDEVRRAWDNGAARMIRAWLRPGLARLGHDAVPGLVESECQRRADGPGAILQPLPGLAIALHERSAERELSGLPALERREDIAAN